MILFYETVFYQPETMLKPTETSKKFEKKIKLHKNYINQCIVFEVYRNFVIKHQQNTASHKFFLHCITCF